MNNQTTKDELIRTLYGVLSLALCEQQQLAESLRMIASIGKQTKYKGQKRDMTTVAEKALKALEASKVMA